MYLKQTNRHIDNCSTIIDYRLILLLATIKRKAQNGARAAVTAHWRKIEKWPNAGPPERLVTLGMVPTIFWQI